jgi:cell division topological specificity factor
LEALQNDLIKVIYKHVSITPKDITVQLERQGNIEVLEVNVILPETVR